MSQVVAILFFEGVQALDVFGPMEVFTQAPGYEVVLVGPEQARSSNGATIGPGTDPDTMIPAIDTLLVCGGPGARGSQFDPRLLEWVKRSAPGARRVGSVCTGAFVLARAGILDGRRVTTHWRFCERLARRYPEVAVEPDQIYVRDGHVWTSAGVTAGVDLALAMVEEDRGGDVALEVARNLVVFVRRPGGQSQFSAQLAAQAPASEPLRDLQRWIVQHPDADLSVPALAARIHMSQRNFARIFVREVDMTPGAYVEAIRVEQARLRLETSSAGLPAIAHSCGFGSVETMRRAFQRRLGVTPSDYRQRFNTQPGGNHEDRHSAVPSIHGARRSRAV